MEASVQTQKNASQVFKKFCNYLDKNKIYYDTDTTNDRFNVSLSYSGDDLSMQFHIEIDASRQIIYALSPLPFIVENDAKKNIALSLCAINNVLASGSFDFDLSSGRIVYRLTYGIFDGLICDNAFAYIIRLLNATVDKYNDKLLMVSKGVLSVEELYNLVVNN
ncbi:MAG: hypothetical protein RR248_02400 [Clostridia bacterium]